MGVGTLGGLILVAVVQAGLGLDPVHPLWTVGLVVIAAATFTGIAHLLRVTAGVLGSAIRVRDRTGIADAASSPPRPGSTPE